MSKPFYFTIPTIPLICYFRPITIIPYHYKRIINKTNNFRFAPIVGPMEINIRTPPHAYTREHSHCNSNQSRNNVLHKSLHCHLSTAMHSPESRDANHT